MRLLLWSAAFLLVFSTSVMAEQIRYDSGERRDPIIPLVTADGVMNEEKIDALDIHIEGIVFDPSGESMVLINNEFYKEGDHVNNANVITIFRDRVILSQADEEKTLWIREEIVSSGDNANAVAKNMEASNASQTVSK